MRIYIMRHGTTVWNEQAIIQGWSQNRLSREGKSLTEKTAVEIKDIKFDIIYTSPLMRTIQTANIINKYHNVRIVKENRIIENNKGIFTGRKKSSLTKKEKALKEKFDKSCGLETYFGVYNRVRDFLAEIKNTNYENILIVTHDICAIFMESILKNKKLDLETYKYSRNFQNAEIREYYI